MLDLVSLLVPAQTLHPPQDRGPSFSGWPSMNKGGAVSGYVGMWLPRILARIFVLENLGRIEDFAKTFRKFIKESTVKTLCDELKEVIEGHE
jgi:hypothetical protein